MARIGSQLCTHSDTRGLSWHVPLQSRLLEHIKASSHCNSVWWRSVSSYPLHPLCFLYLACLLLRCGLVGDHYPMHCVLGMYLPHSVCMAELHHVFSCPPPPPPPPPLPLPLQPSHCFTACIVVSQHASCAGPSTCLSQAWGPGSTPPLLHPCPTFVCNCAQCRHSNASFLCKA